MSMIDVDLSDDHQLMIFERYLSGIGITPRMITNVDTGENYIDGQHAANSLGVTRQNINNCINGRQKTVNGYRLVRASELRREFLYALKEVCDEHGTDYWEVVESVRRRPRL